MADMYIFMSFELLFMSCQKNVFFRFRLLRFKPPPINSDTTKSQIGWRVEFRPTELQFTDFENSAFATFIVLLTRTITALNLNFLITTSKLATNMDRAQHRNACLAEKFYFRQNVTDFGEAKLVEMSLDEIMNGNGEFKGLLYYIHEYLKTQQMDKETKLRVESYLSLVRLRASGVLKTPAMWMREFVTKHEKYEADSKVDEEINYDLMWKICQMSKENVLFDVNSNKIKLDELSLL